MDMMFVRPSKMEMIPVITFKNMVGKTKKRRKYQLLMKNFGFLRVEENNKVLLEMNTG